MHDACYKPNKRITPTIKKQLCFKTGKGVESRYIDHFPNYHRIDLFMQTDFYFCKLL